MMLKFERTWETLGIPWRHKISSASINGYWTWPAGTALPRGGDAYWFLVAGRSAWSAGMPVLRLLNGGVVKNGFFAPSGETTDRIKICYRGAKMARISSITMPIMVGIVVNEKVWCFCLFFTPCDNGNAMMQCNFENNYGDIAQRKVCSS